MLSLYTLALMREALNQPLDSKLHQLLSDRVADICACQLDELTHILDLPDPATSLIDQVLNDPEVAQLGELLKEWHGC